LLFAAFTKPGGTVRATRSGLVKWRVVLHLSVGSIPAALAKLWLLLPTLGHANADMQRLITTTLGVALLITAAATLFNALRGKTAPDTSARRCCAASTSRVSSLDSHQPQQRAVPLSFATRVWKPHKITPF